MYLFLEKTDIFIVFMNNSLLASLACLTLDNVANRLVGMACNGLADVSNKAKAVIHNAARALEGGTADITTSLYEMLNWGIYAAEKTS
jgi:hypothetical protein